MKSVFADTFYFLALLNRRDPAHQQAVALSRQAGLTIVTTEFVLLEVADALCKPQHRAEVLAIWRLIESDPACRLIHATSDLLTRGRKLYRERADKEWPLTDCLSFVVMQDEGIQDALTADRHFEQAGFQPLLAQ
jgi:predicted nucleic acid-binding protein